MRSHTFHFYGHRSLYKAISHSPILRLNLTEVHLDIVCCNAGAFDTVFETLDGCPRLMHSWLVLHHKYYLKRCPHDTRAKVEARTDAVLMDGHHRYRARVKTLGSAVEVIGLIFGVKTLRYGLSRRVKTGKAQSHGLYDERVEYSVVHKVKQWARNEVWYKMPHS